MKKLLFILFSIIGIGVIIFLFNLLLTGKPINDEQKLAWYNAVREQMGLEEDDHNLSVVVKLCEDDKFYESNKQLWSKEIHTDEDRNNYCALKQDKLDKAAKSVSEESKFVYELLKEIREKEMSYNPKGLELSKVRDELTKYYDEVRYKLEKNLRDGVYKNKVLSQIDESIQEIKDGEDRCIVVDSMSEIKESPYTCFHTLYTYLEY